MDLNEIFHNTLETFSTKRKVFDHNVNNFREEFSETRTNYKSLRNKFPETKVFDEGNYEGKIESDKRSGFGFMKYRSDSRYWMEQKCATYEG